MQKDRVSWIDVARGIGIILVVYGHAIPAHSLRYLIYAFHMPLFFFLSGLVFTYRNEQTIIAFLRKNAKSILLPYLIFALLSYVLWIVTRKPSQPEELKQFLSIFYGNGNNSLLNFNNILWFLPCLFLTRLGFFLICKVTTDKRFVVGALFFFSVLGYITSLFFSTWKLLFGLETALTAIVFFGFGFLWKNLPEKKTVLFSNHPVIIFVISLILSLVFAQLNYHHYGLQVDMRVNRLNNYFYFYIAAFAGTLAVLAVSQRIKKNIVLEYLGRNTLVLFAWHLLLFYYITDVLKATQLYGMISKWPKFISPVLYSVTAISLILGIYVFINRIILSLSGRLKKN